MTRHSGAKKNHIRTKQKRKVKTNTYTYTLVRKRVRKVTRSIEYEKKRKKRYWNTLFNLTNVIVNVYVVLLLLPLLSCSSKYCSVRFSCRTLNWMSFRSQKHIEYCHCSREIKTRFSYTNIHTLSHTIYRTISICFETTTKMLYRHWSDYGTLSKSRERERMKPDGEKWNYRSMSRKRNMNINYVEILGMRIHYSYIHVPASFIRWRWKVK